MDRAPAVSAHDLEQARRQRAGRAPVGGRQRCVVWIEGTLCGAMATLATPMAALLCGLLWPGVLALVLDRAPGRPVARVTLLCGVAGSIGPARTLWVNGMGMELSLRVLAQPRVLAAGWLACLGGWLVAELAPLLVEAGMAARSRNRAAQLRAARQRCAEEWGLERRPPEPST